MIKANKSSFKKLFSVYKTFSNELNYLCILISSYLWLTGGQTHKWCHHKQLFYSFKINKNKVNGFNVLVVLFSNRSHIITNLNFSYHIL